jgi:hypothetical protein
VQSLRSTGMSTPHAIRFSRAHIWRLVRLRKDDKRVEGLPVMRIPARSLVVCSGSYRGSPPPRNSLSQTQ